MFYEDGSGLAISLLLTGVVPLGLLVLAIIAVATGRGELDPTGRRGFAIYLAGVLFVTLFVAMFATFGAAEDLTGTIGDDDRDYDYDYDEYEGEIFDEEGFSVDDAFGRPDDRDDDQTTRAVGDALEGLLVALPAALVFLWHGRRRRGLLGEADFAGSPAERIDRAFLHATTFTAAIIVVVGVANVLPDLLHLVAPGLTEPGQDAGEVREDALRGALAFLVLTALGATVFTWAWRQTPDGAGFLRRPPDPAPMPDDDEPAPVDADQEG